MYFHVCRPIREISLNVREHVFAPHCQHHLPPPPHPSLPILKFETLISTLLACFSQAHSLGLDELNAIAVRLYLFLRDPAELSWVGSVAGRHGVHGCDAVVVEGIVGEDGGGAVDTGEAKSGGEAGGTGAKDESVINFRFRCGHGGEGVDFDERVRVSLWVIRSISQMICDFQVRELLLLLLLNAKCTAFAALTIYCLSRRLSRTLSG